MTFEDFFRLATSEDPYGYQVRLARDGLPAVVQAPTGTGKTGVILAWLWRRLEGADRGATPRRLVYALPQRTLVEQVARQVEGWLTALGVADQVALHVVMGGAGQTQSEWRLQMHQPTIVVGTVDSLVSKALGRGYGISRALYPIDFALVTNGAHWIMDEIQLAPESTTTLRQLAAFTRRSPTPEPFGLTCMSATVDEELLCTVDNPTVSDHDVLRIEPHERVGNLATRLDAARTVRRLPVDPGDYSAVADAVRERHRPGTLTLVVLNTVAAARSVYDALKDAAPSRTLVHSRFRGVEREALARRLTEEPGGAGHIVVATQVVEAGIDINAAVMVTEAAPWPSVVQRAGRCNRTGRVDDAELWWLPPTKPHPYPQADIDATVDGLTGLEGRAVTSEEMLDLPVESMRPAVSVIRWPDLLTLFDTAPDLSGADLDISPYVRDAEDVDVQLAWAQWHPAPADGRPADDAKAPPHQWRCRVPVGEVANLRKRGDVWRFDQALGRWTKVSSQQPARPGEVLVMAAADGGYDPEHGLDPTRKRPVPDFPSLDRMPAATQATMQATDPATGAEDAFHQDDGSVAQREWLLLAQHSDEVRDHAKALVRAIGPALPDGAADAVTVAGHAHDAGKCHDIWQDALCRLAPADYERRRAGGPWAKSDVDGRLRYRDGIRFRHELVSMLLLDGPLRALLAGVEDPDLVRYLVLAHHGKLRVQVRPAAETDEKTMLGLRTGEVMAMPPLLGQPGGDLVVDLEQFTFGGDRSWTRTALALRDRYGPFRLAYLETLVRIADWRASARMEEAR